MNVAGYFGCVPGTVMNGMPIGPPSQMPAPKSAWKPLVAPMVVTIDAEFASTGSVSTGVFQMLSAGNTGHDPIIGCADTGPASTPLRTATPRTARDTIDRIIERSWTRGRHDAAHER